MNNHSNNNNLDTNGAVSPDTNIERPHIIHNLINYYETFNPQVSDSNINVSSSASFAPIYENNMIGLQWDLNNPTSSNTTILGMYSQNNMPLDQNSMYLINWSTQFYPASTSYNNTFPNIYPTSVHSTIPLITPPIFHVGNITNQNLSSTSPNTATNVGNDSNQKQPVRKGRWNTSNKKRDSNNISKEKTNIDDRAVANQQVVDLYERSGIDEEDDLIEEVPTHHYEVTKKAKEPYNIERKWGTYNSPTDKQLADLCDIISNLDLNAKEAALKVNMTDRTAQKYTRIFKETGEVPSKENKYGKIHPSTKFEPKHTKALLSIIELQSDITISELRSRLMEKFPGFTVY